MKNFVACVEYFVPSFSASKTIKEKILSAALNLYPQYEFKWVEKINGIALVPYKKAKMSVYRERKGIVVTSKVRKKKEVVVTPIENVEWKPVIIANLKGQYNVEDFAAKYSINTKGKIVVNEGVGNVIICNPYKHGKYLSIDFYNEGVHVNQSVRGLVRRSWGDVVADEYINLYEEVA